MSGILEFISNYGVAVINVFGVILLFLIIWNMSRLKSKRDQIENVLNLRKATKRRIHKKSGRTEEYEEQRKPEWEEVSECEKEFSGERSQYEIYAQCVTLFPLFGILGTVAGLMLQVVAQDTAKMVEALGTALDTTFYGLVWAIVLKFIMAISSAKIIFDVDALLDNYFNGFDRNIALNNVAED